MKIIGFILVLTLCGVCVGAENDMPWIAAVVEKSMTFQKAKLASTNRGARIVWFVHGRTSEGAIIYIGEDVGDHTNRIATLRVRESGETEILTLDSKGDDLWKPE